MESMLAHHANNRVRLCKAIENYNDICFRSPEHHLNGKTPIHKVRRTELVMRVAEALDLYIRRVYVDGTILCVFDPFRKCKELTEDEEVVEDARKILRQWRIECIEKGDRVECWDYDNEYEDEIVNDIDGWEKAYVADILEVHLGFGVLRKKYENNSKIDLTLEEGHPGAIYVSYGEDYPDDNRWLELTQDDIVPLGTHQKSKLALQTWKKIEQERCLTTLLPQSAEPISERQTKVDGVHAQIAIIDETSSESLSTTACDKEVKNVSASKIEQLYKIPIVKAGGRDARRIRKRKKRDGCVEFLPKEAIGICVVCKESECSEGTSSQLFICGSDCRRTFHYACVDLSELPSAGDEWICEDCTKKRHMCAICGEYGDDGRDVFICNMENCGLYYHQHCVANYGVEFNRENGHNSVDFGSELIESSEEEVHFVCPAHHCMVCSSWDNEGSFLKANANFVRCLECPLSCHVNCIPPSSRFHELGFLCPDHRRRKLPYLNLETSEQMAYEEVVDEKRNEVRKKLKMEGLDIDFEPHVKFDASGGSDFLMLRGEAFTSNKSLFDSLSYRCPIDFRDDINSNPPPYKVIHSLKYGQKKPKRLPPIEGGVCNCVAVDGVTPTCGETCFNRASYFECVGGPIKPGGSGERNPYWNCNCGPECGNRPISQRKVAKCKPRREGGKGWGLVPLHFVSKGDLVIEYIGEVVDSIEKDKRLMEWSKEFPNDPNFYIMQLQAGWFIDAREQGNLSRFINHSCDPNCKLVPTNIAGFIRIGIFAIRDIQEGEFLSYDYRFDTRDSSKFICLCGALNCRGTMNGDVKDKVQIREKKTKKQLIHEARQRMDKDKKFFLEYEKKAALRLNLTGAYVPGSKNESSDAIATGPKMSMKKIAHRDKIFLWRNIVLGSNFRSRYETWRSHLGSQRSKETREGTEIIVEAIDIISAFLSKNT